MPVVRLLESLQRASARTSPTAPAASAFDLLSRRPPRMPTTRAPQIRPTISHMRLDMPGSFPRRGMECQRQGWAHLVENVTRSASKPSVALCGSRGPPEARLHLGRFGNVAWRVNRRLVPGAGRGCRSAVIRDAGPMIPVCEDQEPGEPACAGVTRRARVEGRGYPGELTGARWRVHRRRSCEPWSARSALAAACIWASWMNEPPVAVWPVRSRAGPLADQIRPGPRRTP